MIRLTDARDAWGTAAFGDTLKREIEALNAAALPLQEGVARGSHANEDFRAMIISVAEEAGVIRARTGIFYTSTTAGCSCADDPTPADELAEYCELEFAIDKATAEAMVTLIPR